MSETPLPRRSFLRGATTAATALTALSYSRVYGANERIQLGLIGAGERGRYDIVHVPMPLAIAKGLHQDVLHDILGVRLGMQAAECEPDQPMLSRLDESVELSHRLGP